MFFRSSAAVERASDTISIGGVRALLASPGFGGVTLRGQAGGFAIVLHADGKAWRLGTRSGIVRLFSSVAAASNLLQELGIQRYAVDSAGYTPRPRPRAARVTPLQRVDRRRMPATRSREPRGRGPCHGACRRPLDDEAQIGRWVAICVG